VARSDRISVRMLLLARIYEDFPLLCSKYGGEMPIIAFITEAAAVREHSRPRPAPVRPSFPHRVSELLGPPGEQVAPLDEPEERDPHLP